MMTGIYYDHTKVGFKSDVELFKLLESLNPRDNYSFASLRETRKLSDTLSYFCIADGPRRSNVFVVIIVNTAPIEQFHSATDEGIETTTFIKQLTETLEAKIVEVSFNETGTVAYTEIAYSKEEQESRDITEEGRRFVEKYLAA